jgi:K+-transporting ATPase ATPase B chain
MTVSVSSPAINLARRRDLFSSQIVLTAIRQSFVMLRPDVQWKNPVMFVVEIGAVLTLLYVIQAAVGASSSQVSITYFIALDIWLFLTVLFANFATAIAEERGKAQAETLRRTRIATPAFRRLPNRSMEKVSSADLKLGDIVVVDENQVIPGDGEVVEGVALVNEAAITGESAPVIREAGGDRSGVTGGTTVISDRIVIKISAGPGESFLDKMIALVEGARRQRTPNEIALTLVLTAFTLIFMIVVVPLWPMASNAEQYMTSYVGLSDPLRSLGTDVPTLVALIVCLIPTTIGALLAAIGIAGMDRALRANIIAKSGKAVEVAGDIDTVLLDKTGTITLGDRQAREFVPVGDYTIADLARLAALASFSDATPEGKSIVVAQAGLSPGRSAISAPDGSEFVPFTAQTRMSGVDLPDGVKIRKGAPDAILRYVEAGRGIAPPQLAGIIAKIGGRGATPLVVVENTTIAGVVALEDILKPGIHERMAQLRLMGLRTVMITGDNALTAKALAAQAGVDDYIAEATPEKKLAYLRN